jgi:predicted DNA-binding transcriptional regulator YafY
MALLSSNKRISANDLSDRFEVSLRTIYRDIETLNQAGIPVISYSGPDGGYEIMPSYRLDKQVLTLEQLFSIYTAVKGIQSATDNSDMTELLERIGALIPATTTHPSSISLDFQHASNRDVKEKVRSLDFAICVMNVTEFNYMDNQGTETIRTVEPMGLYLMHGTWYLWAYCHIRSALRVFRVSRMNNLKVLPEKFNRRSLTIDDVDKDRQNNKTPEVLEVKLCFQNFVKARVWDEFDHSCIILNSDKTIQVSACYYMKEQAIRHIISFGVHVKILEPLELIRAFRNHVNRIAQLYQE